MTAMLAKALAKGIATAGTEMGRLARVFASIGAMPIRATIFWKSSWLKNQELLTTDYTDGTDNSERCK